MNPWVTPPSCVVATCKFPAADACRDGLHVPLPTWKVHSFHIVVEGEIRIRWLILPAYTFSLGPGCHFENPFIGMLILLLSIYCNQYMQVYIYIVII